MLLYGGSQSPCNCSRTALFNATSIQVKYRKFKLSVGVSLFYCLIEPMSRRWEILVDTPAMKVVETDFSL